MSILSDLTDKYIYWKAFLVGSRICLILFYVAMIQFESDESLNDNFDSHWGKYSRILLMCRMLICTLYSDQCFSVPDIIGIDGDMLGDALLFRSFCNYKQCAISPLHLKYYSVVSHSLISPADFSSEFNTYNLVSVINGLNEMHCWVSPVCTWYFKQFALETWASGLLWKVKRMGPGRDPRQTPENIRCSWGRCPLIYALLVMVCQEGFKPSNNRIPYTKVVQP